MSKIDPPFSALPDVLLEDSEIKLIIEMVKEDVKENLDLYKDLVKDKLKEYGVKLKPYAVISEPKIDRKEKVAAAAKARRERQAKSQIRYNQERELEEIYSNTKQEDIDYGNTGFVLQDQVLGDIVGNPMTDARRRTLKLIREPYTLTLTTATNFDFFEHFTRTLPEDTMHRIEMLDAHAFSKNNPLGLVVKHLCVFLPLMLNCLLEKIELCYRKDMLIEFEFEYEDAYNFVMQRVGCDGLFRVLTDALEHKYRREFPLFADKKGFQRLQSWIKEKEVLSEGHMAELKKKILADEERERRQNLAVKWHNAKKNTFKHIQGWGDIFKLAKLTKSNIDFKFMDEKDIYKRLRKAYHATPLSLCTSEIDRKERIKRQFTKSINKFRARFLDECKRIKDMEEYQRIVGFKEMWVDEREVNRSLGKSNEMLRKELDIIATQNFQLQQDNNVLNRRIDSMNSKLDEASKQLGDLLNNANNFTNDANIIINYEFTRGTWFGFNVNEKLNYLLNVIRLPPKYCAYSTESEVPTEDQKELLYYLCKLCSLTKSKQAIVSVNRFMCQPLKSSSKGVKRWEETFGEFFKNSNDSLYCAFVCICRCLNLKSPLNNFPYIKINSEKGQSDDEISM